MNCSCMFYVKIIKNNNYYTFPFYIEVKDDSVRGRGNDTEVGESGLKDMILLGTGQSWQLQLQHNISFFL